MKGDIVRLYKKMYGLAEELAVHELEQKMPIMGRNHILQKQKEVSQKDFVQEILIYKNKKIKFHMDEMKKLLEMRIKEEKLK
ncbi:MAG: hypothetical protein WC884_04285 [Candidatus Paceibacterota bacterium]